MTLEKWLEPVDAGDPCGPELDYDPDFIRLQEISRPQQEQEFRRDDGDQIRFEGSEVNWKEVRTLAESLLERSKDLRVAVCLTRALLGTEGYGGIRQGLMLIERLLTQHWDSVHPRLDPDDDNDPTMRLNSLVALNAIDEVVADLRASRVIDSRQHGQLSVRDIEVSQQRLPAAAGTRPVSPEQLSAMIQAVLATTPELGETVREPAHTLRAICSLLVEQVSAAQIPDLSLLQGVLDAVAKVFPAPTAGSSTDFAQYGTSAAESGDTGAGTGQSAGGTDNPQPGRVASRADVVETLQKLCDWLDSNEPTNPVQLVLRRAQRMMGMNFLELMQDLAPDGLEQAEKIVGEKLPRDDY
jgi:type VI secretion system protein ImpA